ncbi:CaiB/BaiF CoA transferase family protein [Bordetella hinzii]|uniref:CoA-transferase family III protein n=1 Tax=Bordetella hinzii OH87 BAL007II TaxID=1331262 RepID=A0ABR4R1E5_9BORD|nr:CaiB/BaiF CoA-transferase family protein [Bordetella hinzii]KCB23761.1 CoA-transferase family III protein [Bordetella hinzii OH87 BAL007II]KCB42449.1 CoA-transferase family III protein [Bordetella hinzii 5132]QDJ42153.1 CoA transferase [Bordetella hinzii]QWF37587.1 CoA transferase [Bordetella hinzii]QWF42131.1 CoA transferase [Bordetella hinzii]
MADERAQALDRVAFNPAADGPLKGIRVLDLSRLVAGNMLSLQLADFGADVIKVESVNGGDTLRQWTQATPGHPEGFDAWWQVYARNKRSVALDLRCRRAVALVRELCRSAHVLVESFRPGTLEAMGLGPDGLHVLNHGMIIVRLSGWGQSGPYRDLPGFGSLIEGFSGYALKSGDSEGRPVLPGIALADMVTGLSGAFAVMTALREVEVRGGQGQVIDLSLLEPMLSIMGPDVTHVAHGGAKPTVGEKIASPRGVYRCADGRWVALSGSTDSMARKVFMAIGRPGLFEDERYRSNAARLAHDADIEAMLQDFIGGRTQAACLEHFQAHGVTIGPVHDAQGVYEDAHVRGRGVYVAAGDDAVVMHDVVPRMSATPGALRRRAPAHGEHTREVLAELGFSSEQIADMQAQGQIKCK